MRTVAGRIAAILVLGPAMVACAEDAAETPDTAAGDVATDLGDVELPGDASEGGCQVASDCPGALDLCLGKACVPRIACQSDKQCADFGYVCDATAGVCVLCLTDTDCNDNQTCKAQTCVDPPNACENSKACPSGQVCDKGQGVCVGCVLDADCDLYQNCQQTVCKPDLCHGGAATCLDVGTRKACAANGAAWTVESCGVGASCQEGVCGATACGAGAKACAAAGNAVVTCSADGKAWGDPLACPVDSTCKGGACEKHVCSPGAKKCNADGGMEVCAADGLSAMTWSCPAVPGGVAQSCVVESGGGAVCGIKTAAVAIATGYTFACAVTTAGAVWCWGMNYYGQLGDGTKVDHTVPIPVEGLDSGVTSVVAGSSHACALLKTGLVECWGSNFAGQLGDGTKTDRSTPGWVIDLEDGVAAISACNNHTCALLTNGSVRCWGYNFAGQLGDGTTIDRSSPVQVAGLESGVKAVVPGVGRTCAVLSTGAVLCWGNNDFGELGDGTNQDSAAPVQVIGLTSGVSAVSGGGGHTCALLVDGTLKCWGVNPFGQLGDGTGVNQTAPTDVSVVSSPATAVVAGATQTCARFPDAGVKCWGSNQFGQLGDGTQVDSKAAVKVIGLGAGVAKLGTGGEASHNCAVLTNGTVMCWGSNKYGQLGDGTTTDRPTPVFVKGFGQ
jgi:alpha-tubulin suppressor-like RCC1 family protein